MHQIHQFLGLAGYYRCFIPDFSKIVQPMTKLLQKDVKFVWSPACEEAFQALKKFLTSAPVLAHPRKANVVADALSQKSHQVDEESLSLTHSEVLAHIALVLDLLEQIIIEQRQDVLEIPHQEVNCRRAWSLF